MPICRYCRSEIDPMASVCPHCCRDLWKVDTRPWGDGGCVHVDENTPNSAVWTVWDSISFWGWITALIVFVIIFYKLVSV